ncbi:tetratricopeptide repeat protein [Neisseria sp. CCUG12390]|uniref:tetratricopeptide repeat protein n=1 Tax=Neisseria sp. CCUG12390 TaxID=3392035 RepID=UPI003A0FF602
MASGNYTQAAADAMRAHKLIPASVVPLSDAATAAVKAGSFQDAIVYAKKAIQRNAEHINSYDALSHAYGGLGDWDNAAVYGLKALQLRDRKVAAQAAPDLPPAAPKSDGKKIISFSLFGNSSAYIEPAVLNTELAPEIYPGWVCRFYVDDSVPESALKRMAQNGAEIIRVNGEQAQWPGTLWRFLAIDDPEVSYVIFRDADSVIAQREAQAVAQWIAGGKLFHTIRDAGTHTELILAGLWGAVGQAVPDMAGKIQNYLQQPLESRHFADQFFLRDHIWAYVRQSVHGHDRIFGFHGAQKFTDTQMQDFEYNHIGCDEGCSHFEAAYPLPDGSAVVWKLYSKVSPKLQADGSIQPLPEERLICAYETTVQNGKISGYVPRRYSKGFALGWSRMLVIPSEKTA